MQAREHTVLMIDDNDALRAVVGESLKRDGYRVLAACNAREGMDTLAREKIDVILLDLILPDGNGLTLMRNIRACTQAPIIVISGRAEMTDRVAGLEMGADDYIGKPFEMPELAARIRARLRRQDGAPETAPATVGNWQLDGGQLQIFDARTGRSGHLTVGEFRLLERLAAAPGQVLSREQLLDATHVHGDEAFDRAIDIQITRLRKKIGDDARAPRLVLTVRGAGYMLAPHGKEESSGQ